MIPVEGHTGLYRDDRSNAIINCNDNEYNSYIYLKNKKYTDENEIKTLRKEIDELKNLINQILTNQTSNT